VDRITVMRSFVAVSHSPGFAQAARTLGISGSLVSRHVTELERQVGVRLLNRTARSVSLTEAGVVYADFATRILDEIDAQDTVLLGLRDKPEGMLSVICPKWIGYLDLGDAIAAFAVAYPKIIVRFEVGGMSERTHEFLDQGYDIAFHTRQVPDSSLMIKKMADLEFVVCAAPRYLEAAGTPLTSSDLQGHDCLMHSNYPIWQFREDGRDLHLKIARAGLISNSYLTLGKAAVAGRGVAMLPTSSVLDELEDGRLRRVVPDLEIPTRSLYAIYPPGKHPIARVRLFLDFVARWFAEHPIPRESERSENTPGRTAAPARLVPPARDRRPARVLSPEH